MKDRIRISLTLRPQIVSLLDSKIDGIKLRNRSHAVEHFLKQVLVNPIQQAIIIVENEKDCLSEICQEPVIEKMLKQLKKASIDKIIIQCPKNCTKLKKFLSKKRFSFFDFKFVENSFKGSANSIYNCKKHLDPGIFIVLYSDIFAGIDIYDFIDSHINNIGIGTMAITSVSKPEIWGMVRVKRNRIIEFKEKHKRTVRLTNLINSGILVFNQEIFGYIDKKTKSLETDVFPKLIKDQKLFSYLIDEPWFNISHPEFLKHAQNYCKSIKK